MIQPTITTGTGTVTSVTDASTFNPLFPEKGMNLTYVIEVTLDGGGGTLVEETHTSPQVAVGDKVSFTKTHDFRGKHLTGVTKIP